MVRKALQVDRSKPSTACGPCRKTRSKCDRQRPHCSQCIRKSRVCTGYRDEFELLLRNESDKVQLRIDKRRSTASPLSSSRAFTPLPWASCDWAVNDYENVDCPEAWSGPLVSGLYAAISQPDSVVAANFFFSSFEQGMYLDYIPTLYSNHERSEVLEASFEAMSLSYLAKCKNSPELSEKALHKYSLALQKTTEALSMVSKAVQDDMIASVMLLALFAAFSCDPAEASRTWTNHIDGAMILISLRPQSSFSSPFSQLLLNHVISSIQLNCFQRQIGFPPQLAKLYELSWQSQDPFWVQFWTLTGNIAALRERAVRGKTDPFVIVEQACSLEQEAILLLETIPADTAKLEYPMGYSFTKTENRLVRAWTALKMTRVDLSTMIVSQGKKYLADTKGRDNQSNSEVAARVLSAKITINLIITEICDRMPAFITDLASQCSESNKTVWICTFIWPLSMALDSNVLTNDLEKRIRRHLKTFADVADNVDVSRISLQAATECTGSAQLCASALYFC